MMKLLMIISIFKLRFHFLRFTFKVKMASVIQSKLRFNDRYQNIAQSGLSLRLFSMDSNLIKN